MDSRRLICPSCRTTYVYATDAQDRKRVCQKCGTVLALGPDVQHLEQTQLSERDKAWSEKLLLSVYPSGVIT